MSVLRFCLMAKRVFLLRSVVLALLTVMAARVYCASALPRYLDQGEPNKRSLLRLGQSLTFADFDGDDFIDKATLGGIGRSKSLDIRFGHTNTHTLLRFDTLTIDRGSVFAEDIDNDGDYDLIWTDVIHPDDVIVWMNDGTGRFERVCPDEYAHYFVLTNAPAVDDPENPRQDFASSPQRDSFASLSPAAKPSHSTSRKTFAREWLHVPIVDCCLKTCFERGPPSLL